MIPFQFGQSLESLCELNSVKQQLGLFWTWVGKKFTDLEKFVFFFLIFKFFNFKKFWNYKASLVIVCTSVLLPPKKNFF